MGGWVALRWDGGKRLNEAKGKNAEVGSVLLFDFWIDFHRGRKKTEVNCNKTVRSR